MLNQFQGRNKRQFYLPGVKSVPVIFLYPPPALRVASGGAVFFWRWSSLSHPLRYLQFTLMFWSMSQDVSVVL